jgi:hypothetical protein
MARHLALWSKVRALEAELGGRGTRIVIRGGLEDDPAPSSRPPPPSSRPPPPAEVPWSVEPQPAKPPKGRGSLS